MGKKEKKDNREVLVIQEAGKELAVFQGDTPLIAVQAHIYFTDLAPEILAALQEIPYPYDCYISTDTQEKQEELQRVFAKWSGKGRLVIEVFPNRGRDVYPFLAQLKPVIGKYRYIAHIHSKKSETAEFGDDWRRFLYRHVFGGRAFLYRLFELFEEEEKLGCIFPPIYPVIDRLTDWAGTKEEIKKLIGQLGAPVSLPKQPVFPAGDIFWARVDAVKPLFDRGFTEKDFPKEAGQTNFTLAHVVERIWAYLAASAGYTSQICYNATPGEVLPDAKRIAVYVHYDKDDVLSAVDYETLQAFRLHTKELVVVSNSMLSEKDQEKLRAVADKVYFRKNHGFDFGAWKYVFEELGFEYLAQFDQVILVNNSSIGPIYDLGEMFAEMKQRGKDFWGISLFPACEDGAFINMISVPEHLQSYFLVFEQKVVRSEAFRVYWESYRVSDDFASTIAWGETKLTETFAKAGFSYGAYISSSKDFPQWLGTASPHTDCPYHYAIAGSPFLKKKATLFITKEHRKRLVHYLKQLPIPACYAQYFAEIPKGADGNKDWIRLAFIKGFHLLQRGKAYAGRTLKAFLRVTALGGKRDLLKEFGFVLEREEIPFCAEDAKAHQEDETKLLNWLLPDMGVGLSGHRLPLRFISMLENMGFHSRVYLYQDQRYKTEERARNLLRREYPFLDGRVEIYQDVSKIQFAHATIACYWQTAYFLRRFHNTLSKFYFIQDFEPEFFARGSCYHLAEATYRFGFRGLTAGEWLTKRMREEYRMKADSFGYSYSKEVYKPSRKADAVKRVLFYGRPLLPRREFELGLFVLQELYQRIGNLEIVLAGFRAEEFAIPFPYRSLGIVEPRLLAQQYVNCDLCLLFSETNPSGIVLEMMGAGAVVVTPKGEQVSWLLHEGNAVLTEHDVTDIAMKMEYYLKNEEQLAEIREKGIQFAQATSWGEEALKVREFLCEGIREDGEKH